MDKQDKVIHVGIMSKERYRERLIAIARGEYKLGPDEPKIWFQSLKSLAEILSEDNQYLLSLIERHNPNSLKELAELTGRQSANLSRTLHTLERYGIVRLDKHGRKLSSVVLVNAFSVSIKLATPEFYETTEVRSDESKDHSEAA